ncbi:ROK family protein [Phenylobacterium sp.]|uniref:ROK family protein n=1 Tax=Phenylobacterium sp. TaxID=1871053 RepID=UPI0035B2B7AA
MIRIGVDLGGTKTEAAALDPEGRVLARRRRPTPPDYAAVLETVAALVAEVEAECGAAGGPVGVGGPGSISPATGLVRNANSTWLNGRPLDADLAARLRRPVRYANDANCLALSEATDGAAASAASVFAVILGTGCGAGLVLGGRLLEGANGIAGEWGHTPLPWPAADEHPGPACWCGQRGCLETWISGPAFRREHREATGRDLAPDEIAAAARAGDADAAAALDRWLDRVGRGVAMVCNVVDPEVLVFGGGLSNLPELYDRLAPIVAGRVFADRWRARLVPARWGDSSGVRGAAWLWDGGA